MNTQSGWRGAGSSAVLLWLAVCAAIYIYWGVRAVIMPLEPDSEDVIKIVLWLSDAILVAIALVNRRKVGDCWQIAVCWSRLLYVISIDLWLFALRHGNWEAGWSACQLGKFGKHLIYGAALIGVMVGAISLLNDEPPAKTVSRWYTMACLLISAIWIIVAFLLWRPMVF